MAGMVNMGIEALSKIAKQLDGHDLSMLTEMAERLQRSAKKQAGFSRGNSKQDYQTPPEFIAAVAERFGTIALDLAANAENTQAPLWLGPGSDISVDAFAIHWATQPSFPVGNRWLNPPFERIKNWANKCRTNCTQDSPILFLTPASVGAKWFTMHVLPYAHVLLIQPRLTFVGEKDPYPKDCALSVFGMGNEGTVEPWIWKLPREAKIK